jgi:BirA family biotin operon repressor/biotin-[acetyl-CoA-carboxylase] ligase
VSNPPLSIRMPRFGSPIIELDLVDSTSRYLWALLHERPSLAEGTVVMAHHQYAGRGQRGSTWHAEPGQNLTFSLLMRPNWLSTEGLFDLHKASSLAIAEALQHALPGVPVQVKWPNDVLINGRKACGLLIENHLSGLNVETTVLGVGINVNQSSFGAELANRATSIAREGGVLVDLQPLFGQVLRSLEQWMAQLRQRHDAAVRTAIDRAYLSRLYRYQEWAPFAEQGHTFQGMIVGVTPEGKLAVQTPARDVRYYGFKEVSFE